MQVYRKEKEMLRASQIIKSRNLNGNIDVATIDVIGVVRLLVKTSHNIWLRKRTYHISFIWNQMRTFFSIFFDPPQYNEVYIKRSFKVMRDQIYPIRNN